MAALFASSLSGNGVHVRSAGATPALDLIPEVVQAMTELGLSLAQEFPKPLTDEVVQAADIVVSMGCGDACPIYPGKRYLDWKLTDPFGKNLDEVRAIRDDIKGRVEALLAELAL
jgi:arsenate reductase (thioredoxin)